MRSVSSCFTSSSDSFYKKRLGQLTLIFVFAVFQSIVQGQVTFSTSYDVSPYSDLTKTDAELSVSNLNMNVGYAMQLSENTFMQHDFLFNRFSLNYKNWDVSDGHKIERLMALKYSMNYMHILSEKWSFLGVVTPGLASDFEADNISSDDVTIEAVTVFIRKYSASWSVGYGVAFSRQFGAPIPIPILAIEWNNGSNLSLRAILPANAELWYQVNEKLQLGFVMGGDGNQYHGDPDIYGGSNPKVDFSVLNIGPTLKYRFNDWFSISASTGFSAFRLFEFTNEINGKEVSEEIELGNNAYLKVGFSIGD